jgi:hypothetical protein
MIKYKTKPGLDRRRKMAWDELRTLVGRLTWEGFATYGKSRPGLMAYSRELEELSYFRMERTCSDLANRISGNDDSIASGDLLILDNSHAENSSSTGP